MADGKRIWHATALLAEAAVSKIIFWMVYYSMLTFRAVAKVMPSVASKDVMTMSEGRVLMRQKYNVMGRLYDLLDYPWEREYRTWRPALAGDMHGDVLDMGVGTGRNLAYFPPDARVSGIDLSDTMIAQAKKKCAVGGGPATACSVIRLSVCDATDMRGAISTASIDCVLATFIFCVLPEVMQTAAIAEIARVLRPGGTFRLLEMVYSQDSEHRRNQERWAPFVEWMYGAKFDRKTLQHVHAQPELEVTATRFLKGDVYLLIEGRRT